MALMLKDSRLASNNFRLNTNSWDGVPKPKFLYYIRFMKSGGSGNSDSSNDWTKGIGVLAHTVKRPSISFETETLNQYNKQRVVQKKHTFDEVSVTFHDTVDQRAYHMFQDYYRFYYGEPRHTEVTDWSWDIMAAQMHQAGNWGFIPPSTDPDYSYYFSHIEIYQIYGKKYSQMNIVHPKITTMDLDDLAFEEGSGTLNITMKFAHEGIVYVGNNLTLGSDLINEMGFDKSGFHEPSGSSSVSPVGYNTYDGNTGNSFNLFDPSSIFSGTQSAQPTSTAANRSDGLSGLDTSFNSVLNGLLNSSGTSGVSNYNTFEGEENIANRLVDGLS